MPTSCSCRSADGYRVPERFGVAHILGILTAFGLLFGGLRCFHAPPVFYVFFGVQSVAVCLVQMRFGQMARAASIAVGCVFLPLLAWHLVAVDSPYLSRGFVHSWHENLMSEALPIVILCGGLLGFLTGTVVAGVFLVIDIADRLVQRAARRRARLG